MTTLLQDLRYGFRMLLRRPGFTAVMVIALALGIGANTAIFSVINAVLLQPPPFAEPDRLVMVWSSAPQIQASYDVLPTSLANFIDWREQSRSCQQISAFKSWAWIVTGGREPEQIWGARISTNLFDTLGVEPVLGRSFLREEERVGADKSAIIGYGLWQRRFGADPAVVGKTITLDGHAYTIVGVMPQGFKFPGGSNMLAGLQFSPQTELWLPLSATGEDLRQRGTLNTAAIARLRPGVTLAQAQGEMSAIAERLAVQYPDTNRGIGIKLVPVREQMVGDVRPALLILFGTVCFVLLIACANVANLLLARASTRRREIAIRTALGAGRARLIRQLLTESVLLALLGGAFGLLLAFWGIDALRALIPESIPRATEIGINGRMLGFTLLLSLFTGLIFGLAPALQASRAEINVSLKEGIKGITTTTGGGRLRSLLVVSEIALALVLLVGAGLLLRSFMRLQRVSPGFDPSRVVTLGIVVPFTPPSKYAEPQQQAAFFHEALNRIKVLPGVEAAGVVSSLPLSGAEEGTDIVIEGQPAGQQNPPANYSMVSADYFRVMHIPLVKGRPFGEQDTGDAPGVVIVSETLARRFWPGEDAVAAGKRLTMGFETKPREVVGVVGDIRQTSLGTEVAPAVYLPYEQFPYPGMTLVVRTETSDPASMTAALRREIQSIDRNMAVSNVRTMAEVVSTSVAQRRFNTLLLGIFAGVALLLAAVGVYGVMSYSVTQRTHEIGIRMALGAQGRDVLGAVVGQGAVLALSGVAVGLVGALLLTRVMASLLYEVSPTDPLTFILIPLLLVFVALSATYLPARRASKVDPMVALRHE